MSQPFRRGRDGTSSQRLQPHAPHSRASSSRSDTSRSVRSKSDESEPSSPTSELSESRYTITGIISPPRTKLPTRKPHDEWAKVFSKWTEMRTRLDDQLVERSHREEGQGMGLMEYLLRLSRDPQQDGQLRRVVRYVSEAEGHTAVNMENEPSGSAADPFRQQPRGWVDHQVWLDGWDKARTIPDQPGKILSPPELQRALRPLGPAYVSGNYKDSNYRRQVYVGDADSAAVLAMAKQATISESWCLGELCRGYFKKNPEFRLQMEVISMPAKVANVVYHMPYLSFTREKRVDRRIIDGGPLRETYELSCLQVLNPDYEGGPSGDRMYLNEGMMSVAAGVLDDRWWGVTCFNDEFLAGTSRLEDDSPLGDEESKEDGTEDSGRISQRRGPPDFFQPLDLEQVDPILDQAGGYTNKSPRTYMLIVLDTQLELSVLNHEMVHTVFSEAIKSFTKSGLRRASTPRGSVKVPSKAMTKDALDEIYQFLAQQLEMVKHQEDEVNRFLKKDLGVDPTAKSPTFKDPFFVGLNKSNDPAVKDSMMRIIQSINKLHSLRHRVEDLILVVEKSRKKVIEDLQVAQHDFAEPGLKLGILHYITQVVMIPLNLYNIPHAVSKLPDNPAGLAAITLGLTFLFLAAYYLLSLLFEYAAWTRETLASLWKRLWTRRTPKQRRD